MLAFMNREAWERTLATGEAHYFSRTRNQIWHKGESSGHVQRVKEIWLDCDQDTVLLKVEQIGGAACHTGHRSCFYRRRRGEDSSRSSLRWRTSVGPVSAGAVATRWSSGSTPWR